MAPGFLHHPCLLFCNFCSLYKKLIGTYKQLRIVNSRLTQRGLHHQRKVNEAETIMVGQWAVTNKPSRSDEVLDADQQLQITNQIRARFDAMAPKRPIKPSRSESESDTTPPRENPDLSDNNIPELDKLRSLQAKSQSQSSVLFSAGESGMVLDEFVETQYYKELDSIDKKHHTTGSGFIKVEEKGNEYAFELPRALGGAVSGYRGNPATNDWTPSFEDNQVFVSSKPNRSES